MRPRLKPIEDQTIVITGASSGIGLATARLAAARGARVVLAARSGEALERVASAIRTEGGAAATVVADVPMSATCGGSARLRASGLAAWIPG